MTHPTIEAMARAMYEPAPLMDQEVDLDGRPAGPPYKVSFDRLSESDPGYYGFMIEQARLAAAVLFDALDKRLPREDRSGPDYDYNPTIGRWLAQARTDTLGQPRQIDLTADDGAEGGR